MLTPCSPHARLLARLRERADLPGRHELLPWNRLRLALVAGLCAATGAPTRARAACHSTGQATGPTGQGPEAAISTQLRFSQLLAPAPTQLSKSNPSSNVEICCSRK